MLVPIEKIFRDENQPRKEFDPEKINELAQSIKKNGLIQPLILSKRNYDTYTLSQEREDGEPLKLLILKYYHLSYCLKI